MKKNIQLAEASQDVSEFMRMYEDDIFRLSRELAEANRRITDLEELFNKSERPQAKIIPAGSIVEERAQILWEYLEKKGRATTKQTMKILNLSHNRQAHRVMEFLANKLWEVELKKTRMGMLVLSYKPLAGQVDTFVHLT